MSFSLNGSFRIMIHQKLSHHTAVNILRIDFFIDFLKDKSKMNFIHTIYLVY